MAEYKSKFAIGDSVWFRFNEVEECAVAVIKSVTFYEDNTTYTLHNEEYPWPESYMTVPEASLTKYND